MDTILPKWLGFLETTLTRNGGQKYCVSDDVTIADLEFMVFIERMVSDQLPFVPNSIIDTYPNIQRIFQNVNDIPKITEWKNKK